MQETQTEKEIRTLRKEKKRKYRRIQKEREGQTDNREKFFKVKICAKTEKKKDENKMDEIKEKSR